GVDSRELAGEPSPRSTGSSCSRHVYNSRRLMPSSFASATMLSHCVSRSMAICRKAFGNFPTRFLATCYPLPCAKCARFECLNLGVQSNSEWVRISDKAELDVVKLFSTFRYSPHLFVTSSIL